MSKFIARRCEKIFYSSNEIGLKPILPIISKNKDFFKSADIEDTIVGKAAASLFVYGKVKSVYAHTLSKEGKNYLEKHKIPFQYDVLVKC